MAQLACPDSRTAAFSRCGRYRWWLSRRWRQNAPALLFIGLNPSSADGLRDDPTLRRLVGFADGWGYGAIEVLNLFAWISADPTELRRAAEPVGQRTDAWIRRRVRQLARENQRLRASTIAAAPCSPTPCAGTGGGRPDRSGVQADASHNPDTRLALWLGWGNGGRWRGRDQQLLKLLSPLPVRLLCLGHTAGGQPRHPLYMGGRSPLRPFASSWEQATAPTAAPCPAPRAATRST